MNQQEQMIQSWRTNADAWTNAVRDPCILITSLQLKAGWSRRLQILVQALPRQCPGIFDRVHPGRHCSLKMAL
jgi:hypothetical protein